MRVSGCSTRFFESFWPEKPGTMGPLRPVDVQAFNLLAVRAVRSPPEGPSTQYLSSPVPNPTESMVFWSRNLKYWVLGPSECLPSQHRLLQGLLVRRAAREEVEDILASIPGEMLPKQGIQSAGVKTPYVKPRSPLNNPLIRSSPPMFRVDRR